MSVSDIIPIIHNKYYDSLNDACSRNIMYHYIGYGDTFDAIMSAFKTINRVAYEQGGPEGICGIQINDRGISGFTYSFYSCLTMDVFVNALKTEYPPEMYCPIMRIWATMTHIH